MAAVKTELLVSAAASLTDAFEQIGSAWDRADKGGSRVRYNFAASGVLEQQIRAGAPVDVFASAALKEMDELQAAGRINPKTRINFARNRLVLIVPAASALLIKEWKDISRPQVKRIALANPETVPSGRYGKETLVYRRLWVVLQPKLILAENVRQALTYASGGNVDAGIVFATDARTETKRVRVVAVALPGKDHAPIVYPAAVVQGAPNADTAWRFVRFLQGSESQAILRRLGFS